MRGAERVFCFFLHRRMAQMEREGAAQEDAGLGEGRGRQRGRGSHGETEQEAEGGGGGGGRDGGVIIYQVFGCA